MLAGVLAQSGIRLDRLLAWAEVFGVMRMLRTAAAVTIHALCSAFSFFKLKVLILKRLCTLYVHFIYRHLKAKQSIKTLAESSRIIFCVPNKCKGKTVRFWRWWLHPGRAGINRNLLQQLRGKCYISDRELHMVCRLRSCRTFYPEHFPIFREKKN